MKKCLTALAAALVLAGAAHADDKPKRSAGEILKASPASDWQQIDQSELVYLELANGKTVIFRLAPEFAPAYSQQIRTLANAKFWDGLAVYRVKDNWVVQFGDPDADDETKKKALPAAAKDKLPVEFERPLAGLPFTTFERQDPWAGHTGFVNGLPAAAENDTAWLTHCYGTVGAARADEADSSQATELYVVMGPARRIDRNITVVGRVVSGMEHLSALPRAMDGGFGMYSDPKEYSYIKSVRMGDSLLLRDQQAFEFLKTDSQTFADYVAARRHVSGGWYVRPTPEYLNVCDINDTTRPSEHYLVK